MPQYLELPITNVFAKGDYCVSIEVGAHKQKVNLILDTGSSTLVVDNAKYNASIDDDLTATPFAQDVTYGIGGWYGPVIKTYVAFNDAENIGLSKAHIACAYHQDHPSFAKADGIFGLAFHHLNKGYNLHSYFHQQQISPAETYPWPFPNSHQDVKSFKKFLWQQPEMDITPYFTELEQHGITANKFALVTKRSSVFQVGGNEQDEAVNHGVLVIGDVEAAEHHYQGNFTWLDIVDDIYYNLNLNSVRVDGKEPRKAEPLAAKDIKGYRSNGILDSGASYIVLTKELFDGIVQDLAALGKEYEQLLTPFKTFDGTEKGIELKELKLEQWPNLIFTFENNNGDKLDINCPPQHYWQVNAPLAGQACFKLLSQLPNWPNQSILGLPLFNGYYVVFDRTRGEEGQIGFAQQDK